MVDRLDEIETDLVARRQRAESEGWRGEIEGIEVTLDISAPSAREPNASGQWGRLHFQRPSSGL